LWWSCWGMRGDGERTLETFYQHVQPFATAFMALFGRDRMPHHSTLSRYLSALNQGTVEALRTLASLGSAGTPPGQRAAVEWAMGSSGKASGCLRHRWHARSGTRKLPCPRQRIDRRLNAGSLTSAPQATRDASAGKWCVPALPSSRRIRISGSVPLATRASASTGRNCVEQ